MPIPSSRKSLLQAICQKGKAYWVSVFLTVCLCYGFTLTHSSMGVDDESFQRYFFGGELLMQGRYFHLLLRYIFDSYLYLPFWRDFIGLVLMVVGTSLMGYTNRLFAGEIYDDTCDTIFSCVALSFPFLANLFIFSMSTIELGLNTFFGSIAIYYFYYGFFAKDRSKKLVFLFFLFSVLCAMMGQSGTLYLFACGMLSIMLFFSYARKNAPLLVIIKYYFLLGTSLVFGMIISSFLCKYLQYVYGIQQSSYITNYIQYNISSFHSFIDSFFNFLINLPSMLLSNTKKSIGMSVYVGLDVLFICLAGYYTIKNKNIKFFIIALVTVISTIAMYLFTGNSTLPNRILIDMRLFVGIVVALVFAQLSVFFKHKHIIKQILLLGIVILVMDQSKAMNQVFLTDYNRYQLDLNLTHTIGTMLKGAAGAWGKKPVVFLGIPQPYNLDTGEVEGVSVFSWDRMFSETEETKVKRIYSFMNLHGYSVIAPEYFNEELVRTEVAEMPAWPDEGCVKDLGDYILVKLGTPLYSQYNMSSEEFIGKYQEDVPREGYADWLRFNAEAKTFDVGGWAILRGIDSEQVTIRIALVADHVQYILSTYSYDSQDVTDYFHDGVNYNKARYQVFPRALTYLKPGKYTIYIVLESKNTQSLIRLPHMIDVY